MTSPVATVAPDTRWRRCLPVALAIVLVATGCGGSDEAAPATSGPDAPTTTIPFARPSAGCAAGSATEPATTAPIERRVTVDAVERTYAVSMPPTDASAPAPVIVALHGMGQSAALLTQISDMPARATSAGMVVVVPDAVGSPTLWRPSAQSPDALLLDRILEDLGKTACIDTARIHLAGFSVGAVLAASYACAHQDSIASIVTVEVDGFAGCTKPMSILAFHGTADPVIAYGNFDPAAGAITGTEANMAKWATNGRCDPTPTSSDAGTGAVRLEWTGCAAGSEVVLYRIVGGGHTWPGDTTGATPAVSQLNATDLAIEFVARHHLP